MFSCKPNCVFLAAMNQGPIIDHYWIVPLGVLDTQLTRESDMNDRFRTVVPVFAHRDVVKCNRDMKTVAVATTAARCCSLGR